MPSLELTKRFHTIFPLYTSSLFSMLLNEDIVAIEKPDVIC